MELLLWDRAHERIAEQLAAAAPQVRPIVMRNDGSLWREGRPLEPGAAKPEAAWGSSDFYADGPVRDFMVFLLKSDSVRWMQSGAAGLDHPVFAKLMAKGIRLTNSDATAVAVAEFAVAGVLDAFHPNAERRAAQAARTWARPAFREVMGSTWLVIGMGAIGQAVAVRAGAFGARVIGVRRSPRGDEPAAEMIAPAAVPGALPRADVVVLALPGTAQTRHLVNGEFLARMKPGSVLVNVGRGTLVDEAALLAALERGVPEWAVLDVMETEPLPAESPLWSHPRIRLNAHAASHTLGTVTRNDEVFLDNLRRYVAGEALRFEVDPALFDAPEG